jgi:hypothetical protein
MAARDHKVFAFIGLIVVLTVAAAIAVVGDHGTGF